MHSVEQTILSAIHECLVPTIDIIEDNNNFLVPYAVYKTMTLNIGSHII